MEKWFTAYRKKGQNYLVSKCYKDSPFNACKGRSRQHFTAAARTNVRIICGCLLQNLKITDIEIHLF